MVRVADPDDRRGSLVELTVAGRALVRRARARKIAWIRNATRTLSPGDTRTAGSLARAIDDAASH